MDSNDNWPEVSPRLITKLEEWAGSRSFTGYSPGMTGEAALGTLAEVAGVGLVISRLKLVSQQQQDQIKKTNIPSHIEIRSDDATKSRQPNNSRRWRSGDRRQ